MLVSQSSRRQAITLIEVLVVISVTSILATLAFRSVPEVLAKVRTIQCQTNLRQWGVATQLYADANNDYLPPDGAPNGRSKHNGWYIDLPRQIDLIPYHATTWHTNPTAKLPTTLWLCPANQRKSNGVNLFHYCLNQHISGSGAGRTIQLTSLSEPHRLVWLFDNGKLAAVAQHNNVHTNLHEKGANFLFLDGHVSRHDHPTYQGPQPSSANTGTQSLLWHPQ